MLDFSVDLFGCGPPLLPSHLSSVQSAPLSPSDCHKCELRLVEQRGYTSQDMEAIAQLRGVLDAAGKVGVDNRDLYQTHAHLEDQQCGRTRNLQQYLKVFSLLSLSCRSVKESTREPSAVTLSTRPY